MIFFFILAAILSYLIGERMLHMRRLRRIPIRIHVNGTRGKSSVTRLVAAALQKNGIPTLAKVRALGIDKVEGLVELLASHGVTE